MTMTPNTRPRTAPMVKHQLAAVLIFAVLSLTATGWTGQAWGQTDVRRVGILTFQEISDAPAWSLYLDRFHQILANRGWVEGKNLHFDYGNAQRDPAAAVALVELEVDVIWAWSAPAMRAAYKATRTIPIVGFDYTADPVAEGYIESYRRPGGNVTGVFLDAPELVGKWFELLQAMNSDLSRVALLWDPAPGTTHVHAARSIASSLDVHLQVLEVREPDDIDKAFDAMVKPQAVIISPSPMIYRQSARLAKLALKHGLPAISFAKAFANAGGAIAYGPEDGPALESVAILVAKILDGASPAELPVERPTKIQLIVNQKTAKALGITIPQSILLRADEVIR